MSYKGKKITDGEDRTEAYRDWRHKFGKKRYVVDLDQVEYKIINGNIVPVAVLELTRADWSPGKSLQDTVLKRIDKQYAQGKALRELSKRIGVDAYIVLFVKDLSEFHIYNLTRDSGWHVCDQEKYSGFIDWLHREKTDD